MTDWLRLSPPGGPRPVQEARTAGQRLVDQLPADRQKIDEAKAQQLAVEKAKREADAAAMRRGEEPVGDVESITRAREGVAASEHRHAARTLAIADAQEEFRATVEHERDQWRRAEQREVQKLHTRAVKAHAAFQTALDELGQARAIVWWLEPGHGFDRAQGWPSVGLLGDARSSAAAMANSSPASRASLMAWCAELIGDPPAAPGGREAAVEPASASR